jgi:protein TonB
MEDPAELASALAWPPQPLTRLGAAAGSSLWQLVVGMPSLASGPAGGPLPSVDLGPGSGYDAGRLDRAARPAGSIRPHYPVRARQRGEEADVAVDVWVGAQGDVDRVAVSRSAGTEFDAAALAAVQQARFHPALRDGRPVPSRVALRLHFRLER